MLDQSIWWKMLTLFYPEVYFHLSEAILTAKNGKSLCFLRRSLGSSTLTSKTYWFLKHMSFLTFPLFFFLGVGRGKISNVLPYKQMDFLLHKFVIALAYRLTACVISSRISFSNISVRSVFLSSSSLNFSRHKLQYLWLGSCL